MWPDARFPEDPYPGAAPPTSFVHLDAVSRPLLRGRVDGVPLDTWLRQHGAAASAARVPLLAYGSNRCPSKITWLRWTLGLGPDPVVVLRASTSGVTAVWAAGPRVRDDQRPAVLAAAPGVVEQHAVWLATPAQVEVLDRCEGREVRFRLARLHTGEVRTEDGMRIDAPWCYLGHAPIRRPLLVAGSMARCADVGQAAARALQGVAAPGDGLDAETVVGAPRPEAWPAALFVYGLLRPGQVAWRRIAGHAAGSPRAATIPGGLFDTGRGYPGWLPDEPGTTPGVIVPVHDPPALLPELDAFEGPEYERVRVIAGDTVCWAYAWRGATRRMRPLPAGWPAR